MQDFAQRHELHLLHEFDLDRLEAFRAGSRLLEETGTMVPAPERTSRSSKAILDRVQTLPSSTP
jgi:hypothetical protein